MPLRALDSAGRPVRVGRLGLEFSFDDGATWTPARAEHGVVTVRYPRGSGHVSIRVTGAGPSGAETTQTVIRAYRYR
jgi:hypothetical protein